MDALLVKDTYDAIKERKAHVPENYGRSKGLDAMTAAVIDAQEVFRESIEHQLVPILRLQVKTRIFYIPKPIAVDIYRDGDLFFAENENLVVCGTGDTPQSALEDLCLHIVHFFEYYKRMDKSKLTGDALRLKELYKDLLVEESRAD